MSGRKYGGHGKKLQIVGESNTGDYSMFLKQLSQLNHTRCVLSINLAHVLVDNQGSQSTRSPINAK